MQIPRAIPSRSIMPARIAAALPLAAILAGALFLRLWRLSENGYGREYYAAAVRGMLDSWHGVFFNAFDPAGFVSLDKPPVAIWFQALFAKLFGFSALNSLLPQVILGLAAIVILYAIVRRTFGNRAALIAAALLAITPVSVAVDRSNNTESCLIVVLLAASWLSIRAAESGRLLPLCGAMLALGVGFNVKMAAALVLAPIIVLTFFFANRQKPLARHAANYAIAGAVLVAVSLSWPALFDLTPKADRPYAGSTRHNSMLELALVHNGTDRFVRPARNAATKAANAPKLWDESPTGTFRLLRPLQGGQAAWWLPLALAGAIAAWWTGQRQTRIAAAVFGGWLMAYWIVFSFAGGPFHTYYLAALAPPLAALAGVGVARLLGASDQTSPSRWLVALLAASALWQLYLVWGEAGLDPSQWLTWLALGIAAAVLVVALLTAAQTAPVVRRWPVAFSLAALAVLPLVCALSVVLIRPNTLAPAANLAAFTPAFEPPMPRINRARAAEARRKLLDFLERNRMNERYLLATQNSFLAAPLIIASGKPVMAMGGYAGLDAILTPEDLANRVRNGELRFVMLGGFSLVSEDKDSLSEIRAWVRANGTRVDPALWSIAPARRSGGYRVRLGGTWVNMATAELYDLRR